jgi:hypothetical protein
MDRRRLGIAFLQRHRLLCLAVALLAVSFQATYAAAQELAPRAYWPAPKGTKALVFGYQYSTGDVVTDPSVPIAGMDSRTHFIQPTYLHTLDLYGRTANVQFSLPYSWGTSDGFAEGEFRSSSISGVADARVRLSVNLLGAPTMDVAGFRALRARPRTLIGAGLLVQAPTGDYEPDKLINAGTNRWSVKPALGFIWPVRPTWLLEVELGAWLFGDNDDFLGATREQDPLLSSEFHLVKRIRAGFWTSLDVNYYRGGRTTVDQDLRDDRQENSRIGGTLLYPFKGHHALRGSYSTGIITESGGHSDNVSLSYLYVWR